MHVVERDRLAILSAEEVGGWQQTVEQTTVRKCRLHSKHSTPAGW